MTQLLPGEGRGPGPEGLQTKAWTPASAGEPTCQIGRKE